MECSGDTFEPNEGMEHHSPAPFQYMSGMYRVREVRRLTMLGGVRKGGADIFNIRAPHCLLLSTPFTPPPKKKMYTCIRPVTLRGALLGSLITVKALCTSYPLIPVGKPLLHACHRSREPSRSKKPFSQSAVVDIARRAGGSSKSAS